MTGDRGSFDNTGSSVLDQLEFMEEFVGETKKKGVTTSSSALPSSGLRQVR